jgi:hypothetical protein
LSPNPATDITLKSRAGTPFDTPDLSAAEAVADINVTNFTIKARLDAIQNGPRPRFVYKVANHPWAKESPDSILRRVSRDARWHAFLFHGKYYWGEILSQYFLPPGKSKENLPRTMMKSSGQRLRYARKKPLEWWQKHAMKNIKS